MSTFPTWARPVAGIAAFFGILTIFSGGTALFGSLTTKGLFGATVPSVLWFNFLAGFAYIAGALTLFKSSPWAPKVAWLIG